MKRKRGPFGGGPSTVPMKRSRSVGPRRSRLSSGELKFFDSTLDDTLVASAGGLTDSICLIADGTTESERVGRKCTLRSVHWRYTAFLGIKDAVATPALPDSLRIIMYQDKQCNGLTAAITDVLDTANIHSFRNLSNSSRFNILCDKLVSINYDGLASDGAGVVSQARKQREFVWYKKLNIPLEFSGITGALTEVRSNNVGVILISANGTVGFQSQLRLRFSDRSA